MAFEGKYRFVRKMLRLSIDEAISSSVSVVELRVLARQRHAAETIMTDCLADVPDFEQLVFAI